ncbi:MAG: squalene/phytoene synthase family protein [Polyangiaceae bacterium]|nr:squalene/phytoene synthase family protein [Polyangiaceae bacterium]
MVTTGMIIGSLDVPAIDRDFCRAVLPRVSRSFALSIEALPPGLREAVRTTYLLCRIVDTVEDQVGLVVADRTALYDDFDAALAATAAEPVQGEARASATRFEDRARALALDADGAGGELCRQASVVFAEFAVLPSPQRAIIRRHVAEMSGGMREFSERADRLGRLRLRDIADLERYCYFVAGTLGQLLTALFELEVPSLSADARTGVRERAISFGLGLQMVNIVKDVAEDHLRGDVFLPESLASDHGVELDSLLLPQYRVAGLSVVGTVSRIARSHLDRAREYTLLWPPVEGRDVRLFCTVPLALALATLHEVDHGEATLRADRKPKVTRAAVTRILGDTLGSVGDDAALAELFERCERGEYG